QNRPLKVTLPNVVELKIVQTDPGVRGDTVSGGAKPATLESGATVNVPLFIDEGEVIRLDTRTGEYLGRACWTSRRYDGSSPPWPSPTSARSPTTPATTDCARSTTPRRWSPPRRRWPPRRRPRRPPRRPGARPPLPPLRRRPRRRPPPTPTTWTCSRPSWAPSTRPRRPTPRPS